MPPRKIAISSNPPQKGRATPQNLPMQPATASPPPITPALAEATAGEKNKGITSEVLKALSHSGVEGVYLPNWIISIIDYYCWKPIETAPKGRVAMTGEGKNARSHFFGETIWAWREGDNHLTLSKWHPERESWMGFTQDKGPTHWMPYTPLTPGNEG